MRAALEPKMEVEHCEVQARAATVRTAASNLEDQLFKVSIAFQVTNRNENPMT